MIDDRINECLKNTAGICAVLVKNLHTGESFAHNEHEVFPAASLIKLFILLEFFKRIETGELSPDDRFLIKEDHMVSGFGILKEFSLGLCVSYLDLATLMIVLSDNVATNILIDKLGMEKINARAMNSGYTATSLQRKMMDAEAKKRGLDNFTSPADVFKLLLDVESGKVLAPEYSEKFIDILKRQQCNNKLPLLLPEGTVIAHKTGDLPLVEHDAGILFVNGKTIILVVMTKALPDNSTGIRFNNTVGALAYDYFNRV